MVGRVSGGFPVKIVAVTSQATQAAIATLVESGITSPKGLEGKTLADLPSSIVIRLFPFYAKRAGIYVLKGEDRPRHASDPPVAVPATGRTGCDRPVHRGCAYVGEGGRRPSGSERSSTRSI